MIGGSTTGSSGGDLQSLVGVLRFATALIENGEKANEVLRDIQSGIDELKKREASAEEKEKNAATRLSALAAQESTVRGMVDKAKADRHDADVALKKAADADASVRADRANVEKGKKELAQAEADAMNRMKVMEDKQKAEHEAKLAAVKREEGRVKDLLVEVERREKQAKDTIALYQERLNQLRAIVE